MYVYIYIYIYMWRVQFLRSHLGSVLDPFSLIPHTSRTQFSHAFFIDLHQFLEPSMLKMLRLTGVRLSVAWSYIFSNRLNKLWFLAPLYKVWSVYMPINTRIIHGRRFLQRCTALQIHWYWFCSLCLRRRPRHEFAATPLGFQISWHTQGAKEPYNITPCDGHPIE